VRLEAGQLVYTPVPDFNGVDSFTYTVDDGQGGLDSATVTMTVTPINDDPVAADDAATTDEDHATTFSLLVNDTDPDGDLLAVSALDTSGTLGAVTLNADGSVTYDPNGQFEYLAAGATATDTFSYAVGDGQGGSDTALVTVTITGVDDGGATAAIDIQKYVKLADATASIGNFVWHDLAASSPKGNNGVGNGLDPQPPGNPPINDGPDTAPGNPGNRGGAEPTAATGDAVTDSTGVANGIQDAGEPGIGGVVLNLLTADGTVLASATTSENGYYLFTGLTAGPYSVEVALVNFLTGGVLSGWSATLTDQGTDDSRDSDGDIMTYGSAFVTLASGETNTDVDFGFYLPGAGRNGNNGVGNGIDPQPPGNPPVNDGAGATPGNPGNRGGATPGTTSAVDDSAGTQPEQAVASVSSSGSTTSEFGDDADAAPGLVASVGDAVVFTYVVTNPGDVALGGVTVLDDNQTPGDPSDDFTPSAVLVAGFNVGDTDRDGLLDFGEQWLYTATAEVTAGQHVNVAEVTGVPLDGGPVVSDTDAAYWFGAVDADGIAEGLHANAAVASGVPVSGARLVSDDDAAHWTGLASGTSDTAATPFISGAAAGAIISTAALGSSSASATDASVVSGSSENATDADAGATPSATASGGASIIDWDGPFALPSTAAHASQSRADEAGPLVNLVEFVLAPVQRAANLDSPHGEGTGGGLKR
jgi:VCBS repeat-containing protein